MSESSKKDYDHNSSRITRTKGNDIISTGKDGNISITYGEGGGIGLTRNGQLVLPPDFYPPLNISN